MPAIIRNCLNTNLSTDSATNIGIALSRIFSTILHEVKKAYDQVAKQQV